MAAWPAAGQRTKEVVNKDQRSKSSYLTPKKASAEVWGWGLMVPEAPFLDLLNRNEPASKDFASP